MDMTTDVEKRLIIMRGLPWTGKSYRTKQLVEEAVSKGIEAKVFSTDEYWYKVNFPDKPEEYSFNRNLLGTAHKWNQLRTQRAIDIGSPLIIVDNTNTTSKEFCCAYAKYATWQGYEVSLEEPTSERWLKIRELLKRKRDNNKELKAWAQKLSIGSEETHSVPFWTIEKMMWRWESDVNIEETVVYCELNHSEPPSF